MRALEGLSNSGGKQPRDKSAIVGLHMTEFEQESGCRASAGSTSWDAQGWALGEGLCCDPGQDADLTSERCLCNALRRQTQRERPVDSSLVQRLW